MPKGSSTTSASRTRKPKLGQHFLTDRDAARTIVEALGNISDQIVIEIGPGYGAITEILIPRAGHLIAIELDHVLAAQMRLKYARFPNVEFVEGDFLRIEIPTLLGHKPGLLVDPAFQRREMRQAGRRRHRHQRCN